MKLTHNSKVGLIRKLIHFMLLFFIIVAIPTLGQNATGAHIGYGKGLFYGDGKQFIAELIGVATCAIFVFVVMYLFFKISNKITPIRVKAEDEIAGLDIPEMGVHGYVD